MIGESQYNLVSLPNQHVEPSQSGNSAKLLLLNIALLITSAVTLCYVEFSLYNL